MSGWPLLEGALKAWGSRLPLDPRELAAVGGEAQRRAFWLAGVWEKSFLADVQASLGKAMEAGKSLYEWLPDGQKILAGYGGTVQLYRGGGDWNPWYADLVLRNAVQRSFSDGRHAAMWSSEWQQIAPFWRYSATLDDRTRPTHAALNGKVFRKDDTPALAYYPPWGHSCRCQAQELTLAEVEAAGYQVTRGAVVPTLLTRDGSPVGSPPAGWGTDRPGGAGSPTLQKKARPAKRVAVPTVAPPKAAPPAAPAPEKGPKGTKVSKHVSFISPARREQGQRILGLIDSVHGDGTLGDMRINFPKGTDGFWKPGRIKVGKDAPHWAVQQAHEVGHWLDRVGMSPGRFVPASHTTQMDGVMKAIRSSKAFARLGAQPMHPKDRAYLLKPTELWARAYSQYIAEETGDKEMLAQVALWRSGKAAGRNPDGLWDSLDFAPIRDEISRLMRKLGWQT